MQIPLLQYPLPSSVQPPLLTRQAEWLVSGIHVYIILCYIIIYMLCISSSISKVDFSSDISVLYKLPASQCERATATEKFYS